MKSKIFAVALLTVATATGQAESLVEGDAEAGRAKAVVCGACHGVDGNSVNPAWPSLAGQHAGYSVEQLQAFRNATRSDPLMTAQAMLLSEEDMRNLSVYFEAQQPAAKAVADPASVRRGEAIYRGGIAGKGVAACIACHGPNGNGNPAAGYPAIAGQYATYAAKQLRDYASGALTSDGPTRVMRDIASRLTAEEIDAISSYVQGLH